MLWAGHFTAISTPWCHGELPGEAEHTAVRTAVPMLPGSPADAVQRAVGAQTVISIGRAKGRVLWCAGRGREWLIAAAWDFHQRHMVCPGLTVTALFVTAEAV